MAYQPCYCCVPGSFSTEYAWLVISGVKDLDYPLCTHPCGCVNGTYLMQLADCGGDTKLVDCLCHSGVRLVLETNGCYKQWHVFIDAAVGMGAGVEGRLSGIDDCTAAVTVPFDIPAGPGCDYSGMVIQVIPIVTDWHNPYFNDASCLPVNACKPIVSPFLALKDSAPLGSDAICCQSQQTTCCCGGSFGFQIPIPAIPATGNCGCTQNVNNSNGNLALSFAIPAADSLAPKEQLYYNSSSLFGPDSPFADSVSAAPPAGFNVSGLNSIRLVADAADNAYVLRCDGSIDLYRCKDATTHEYIPVHTRNTLVQNVNGSGTPIGWTETTVTNGFQYNFAADGTLTSIQNPAGQVSLYHTSVRQKVPNFGLRFFSGVVNLVGRWYFRWKESPSSRKLRVFMP